MKRMSLWKTGIFLWMCLVNTASSLSITWCEIVPYNSIITCYWKNTQTHNDSGYTLQINKNFSGHMVPVGSCESRGSSCSVHPFDSRWHIFSSNVRSGSSCSPLFSFTGFNSVKLQPPHITHVRPSGPGCLLLGWEILDTFLKNEKSKLLLQLNHSTHDQTWSQILRPYSNQTLDICGLHSGSQYTLRLRAQYSDSPHLWSSWTSIIGTTEEHLVPSAAPLIWRFIRPSKEAGMRHLTVLWKAVPWPEVNGVVLRYLVSCRSRVNTSQWSCGALNASSRSCDLRVPVHPIDCSLTAWNSAGASPPAHIHLPSLTDTPAPELPHPRIVNITPLNETQLQVDWTADTNQSESGFVVQWISLSDSESDALQWQILNSTARRFTLTDLSPEVPYNISIVSLFGEQVGGDFSVIAFTREGAPSIGPQMTVLNITSDSFDLKWDPVPLEKLHGFNQRYTVLYSINGKEKSKIMEGNVVQASLTGLMEGRYSVCVKAHTAAGGATGPCQIVNVDKTPLLLYTWLFCALFIFFLVSIILCIRIKHCLFSAIPDPSKSSLSTWSHSKPTQHYFPHSCSLRFIMSDHQCFPEKDFSAVEMLRHTSQNASEDIQIQTSSASTYRDQQCLIHKEAFSAHLLNKYPFPTEEVASAAHQDNLLTSYSDFLLETDFACGSLQINTFSIDDLFHMPRTLPALTVMDDYRPLNPDELSRF